MMNGELEGIVDKWKELFSYFEKLFKLQWIDLNLRIFKSLQDLMNSFNIQKNTDIRQLFLIFGRNSQLNMIWLIIIIKILWSNL